MAVLYITEYRDMSLASNYMPVAKEAAITEQNVAIGGTSTRSSAFNAATRFVRLHTDAICSIAFGDSPTAVATAKRMAAGQTEYFGVAAGQKVAVITNT